MRYLVLILLTACSSGPGLPTAGRAILDAKQEVERADAVYTRACIPPALPELVGPCHEIAGALDASERALQIIRDAYTVVNDAAKAAQ